MEALEYNLLYRWFGIKGPVWDPTVVCSNRNRLLAGGVTAPVPGSAAFGPLS